MLKSIHSETYNLFTELMVQARKDAGLTQQQLADRLGKPQSFVAKYETGERRLDLVEFLEITGALAGDPVKIINALEETRTADG
jgi:transcriptional regulator with XRE-family HTH domain